MTRHEAAARALVDRMGYSADAPTGEWMTKLIAAALAAEHERAFQIVARAHVFGHEEMDLRATILAALRADREARG